MTHVLSLFVADSIKPPDSSSICSNQRIYLIGTPSQPVLCHPGRPLYILRFASLCLLLPTMATPWSLDFCLVCDRQTLGGAYCSQTCRLSEIDSCSSGSEPQSPNTTSQPWATADGGPAIDFSSFKGFQSETTTPSYKPLSPSSSQTSLTSLGSTASSSSISSSSSAMSGQIRSELQDYECCFDQVRDWKRRLTAS